MNSVEQIGGAAVAEGYLMMHIPRKFNKWQRRWFTLGPTGVLRSFLKHNSAESGSETAKVMNTSTNSSPAIFYVNFLPCCPLQVDLRASPTLVVAADTMPECIPPDCIVQWRQMSDYDLLIIPEHTANILLRAASTVERNTWVQLLQQSSGHDASQCIGQLASDEALVSALNELHATAGSMRVPFLASSTMEIEHMYDMRDTLGQGSVAGTVVRLARHRASGEVVAVKQVPKSALKSERQHETMKREIEIMLKVTNSAPLELSLVRVYAIIETATMVYIVMELVEGGELFDHVVDAGCYSEGKARLVMRQLLLALQHLHSIGIIHRDIKPENILCARNGVDVKISDFGLSNRVSPANGYLRSQCGTPVYMAPEMLQKRPYASAVDVWSVGIVCYILLSGSMPFYADNPADFLDLILTARLPEFPEDEWATISPEAKDLITQMLCVDPQHRVKVDAALAHPWMQMG